MVFYDLSSLDPKHEPMPSSAFEALQPLLCKQSLVQVQFETFDTAALPKIVFKNLKASSMHVLASNIANGHV